MGASAPDVAVVGGGLVGLCSALALQRAGLSTLLIDNTRGADSASFGNAGHIAVEQVQPLANPAAVRGAAGRLFAFGGPLDFRLPDLPAWGGWALRYLASSTTGQAQAGARALGLLLAEAAPAWRRLTHGLDRTDLLKETGHLVVWDHPAGAKAGRVHWTGTPTGSAKLRELSDSERLALAAALGRPIADGVGFDGTAQVASPSMAMDVLNAAFLANGGERLDGRVRELRCALDQAGLELDDREIWPGLVVVASGVGSGPLIRSLGLAAPVVAERGYHIEADTNAWDELPPVVFEDRSLIATRFGGRLRASSFVEFARPDAPADPRKWARLERHAKALGLPMQGNLTHWMGARPTLPDYLPAIGRSRQIRNLIYAFGHQHLGLTLAPLTGELVADLALERAPATPLQAFELERFRPGARRAVGRSP